MCTHYKCRREIHRTGGKENFCSELSNSAVMTGNPIHKALSYRQKPVFPNPYL